MNLWTSFNYCETFVKDASVKWNFIILHLWWPGLL